MQVGGDKKKGRGIFCPHNTGLGAGQAACLTVVLLPRRDRDRDDPLLFSVIRVDRRPSSSSSCGGGWPLSLASASLRHKTKTALLVGFLASRDSHPEARWLDLVAIW